jgi:hypothetical protein
MALQHALRTSALNIKLEIGKPSQTLCRQASHEQCERISVAPLLLALVRDLEVIGADCMESGFTILYLAGLGSTHIFQD